MTPLPACPTLAKALHDGATVIRVPVVPQPMQRAHPVGGYYDTWEGTGEAAATSFTHGQLVKYLLDHSPLGKPGDVVGVQEVWGYNQDGKIARPGDYISLMRSANTMPPEAIRLRYTVKAVRVERVADNWNEDERLCGPDQDGWFTEPAYAAAWNSRLTPEGERYGDVYSFDSNPWTIAAEVEREQM